MFKAYIGAAAIIAVLGGCSKSSEANNMFAEANAKADQMEAESNKIGALADAQSEAIAASDAKRIREQKTTLKNQAVDSRSDDLSSAEGEDGGLTPEEAADYKQMPFLDRYCWVSPSDGIGTATQSTCTTEQGADELVDPDMLYNIAGARAQLNKTRQKGVQ